MRAHPKECYSILMDAAAAALRAWPRIRSTSAHPAEMTAVLHTWGRDLSYNPHVHFVVAAGGLSADGKQWLPSRVDYLVPVMALSVIYRAKVRDKLKAADCWTSSQRKYGRSRGSTFQSCWRWPSRDEVLGSLHLPSSHQRSQGRSIEPGPDGQGQVTYDYRPVGSRQTKSMSVTAPEFIRRFVQHVLPSGFRKVRHYGLASARSPMDIELLKWLVTITLHVTYVLTVCARPMIAKHVHQCQHCGGALKLYGFIPPMTKVYDSS